MNIIKSSIKGRGGEFHDVLKGSLTRHHYHHHYHPPMSMTTNKKKGTGTDLGGFCFRAAAVGDVIKIAVTLDAKEYANTADQE